MTYPAITASPPAPQRTQAGDAYAAAADTWAAWLESAPDELNALAQWFEDTAATLVSSGLSATSSASITIGTGSKSFAASAGSAFTPGQSVVIASTANPTNSMTGTITAYDSGTGNITVNVTSVSGSGTFASWTIGLALVADLSAYLAKAGGTMTGLLTLAAAQGLLLTPGSAPGSPADGQIWRETNKLMARIGAVNFEVVLATLAQTLTNKTLTSPTINGGTIAGPTISDPILTGTPTTDIFAITDGASVTINPADGEVQTWTLGANRTPTLTSITAGKAVLLMIDDGSAYSLTLSSVTWLNNSGAAPTLKTSGYTPILLFNVGGTLYAWLCGDGG